MLRIDHVGIVVPPGQLEAAADFYCSHFGCVEDRTEQETDVNPDAIGLPGEHVRLKGAILSAGDGASLEIHEYRTPVGTGTRRTCDTGIGHFAWRSDDIDADYARLADAGITWNAPIQHITAGALAGRRWIYGRDPWGNVVELLHHPDPISPQRPEDLR